MQNKYKNITTDWFWKKTFLLTVSPSAAFVITISKCCNLIFIKLRSDTFLYSTLKKKKSTVKECKVSQVTTVCSVYKSQSAHEGVYISYYCTILITSQLVLLVCACEGNASSIYNGFLNFFPANWALSPNSSSILYKKKKTKLVSSHTFFSFLKIRAINHVVNLLKKSPKSVITEVHQS